MKRSALLLSVAILTAPLGVAAGPITSNASVDVTGVVCNVQIPQITSPTGNTVVSESTINLLGTGAAGGPIVIYRGGTIIGAGIIDGSGQWTVPITLLRGVNVIKARQCLFSPDHIITYQPSPPAPPSPTFSPAIPVPPSSTAPPSASDAVPPFAAEITLPPGGYARIPAGLPVLFAPSVTGGRGPYRYIVDAGDGSLFIYETNSGFPGFQHTYQRPGGYQPRITIMDADGRVSVLQYAVEVTGPDVALELRHRRLWETLLMMYALEALLVVLGCITWEYWQKRQRIDDDPLE